MVAIRGSGGTRDGKVETEGLDGVVLAAAGLKRLGIDPPRRIDLPVDRFVPAPAQGALAIQTRENDDAREFVAALDHSQSRRMVESEREFLRRVGAGFHTPVAALASLDGDTVSLPAQPFRRDG